MPGSLSVDRQASRSVCFGRGVRARAGRSTHGRGEGPLIGATALGSALATALKATGGDADLAPAPAGYAVAGPRPVATVVARDEAAVVAVVSAAGREGWSVVVRGGGTQDTWGGAVAHGPVVVLDTSALRGIVAHAPGDLTARVRPGTRLAELNAALRTHGQMLAADPPGSAQASVGGIVAGDAWGPSRLLYGSPRDWVLGLRVSDGGGQLYQSGGHVVKNVSGLDVGKLLVGSFGTLGVLTEVSLKLRPLPPGVAHWAAVCGGAADAWTAVRAVLSGAFQPVGVTLALGPLEGVVLCVRLEGGAADLADQRSRLEALGRSVGVTVQPEAAAAAAWAAAHQVAGALLVRCEVPDGALPDLWQRVLEGSPAIQATAWAGIGTLWCAVGAEGPPRPQPAAAALLQTARGVRAAAEALGGRAVVVDCPPEVRAEAAPFGEAGDLLPWFRALKARFDPEGVLGPGRFVGGI